MVFARLSDVIGRKPVMMFGLGLAAISLVPGFQWLTAAVNPALTHAAAVAPASVVAYPADCSVQFDPVGGAKFLSSCDIAKRTLADAGVPYRNEIGQQGATAEIRIGARSIASFDGNHLSSARLLAERARFERAVRSELAGAGYPLSAKTSEINVPRALLLLGFGHALKHHAELDVF